MGMSCSLLFFLLEYEVKNINLTCKYLCTYLIRKMALLPRLNFLGFTDFGLLFSIKNHGSCKVGNYLLQICDGGELEQHHACML